MKKAMLSAAIAFSAMVAVQPALAATTVQTCGSGAAGSCSITFNGTNGVYSNLAVTNSPFTDTYLFDLGTGTLSLDLTTTYANARQDIDFSLVRVGTTGSMVNVPFVLGTDETYRISNLAVTAGQYMLTLTGARDSGNANSAFNASYTGNINFAAGSAVPEPATWAMMLLGFGLVGATMRRRAATARVTFA
ncbi:FxDxF family PEP-CTERM protein [Sphingomonas floccifaciens]|uniref:FxDxF family PEP-CTERM protein n=1 Tax=Sphingomonas floccifaciens TaxID=1844115 RepID=A0ABW4NA00_9SPHN